MGKKFTSIHVIDSNINEVGSLLAGCQFDNHVKQEEWAKSLPKNLDLTSLFTLLKNTKAEEAVFYLINTNGNISVFSEYLISQTLKDKLVNWFEDYDKFVLSVDYFDDDFLEIQVYKNLKFIISLVIGDNLDDYSLIPAKFDENIICEIFNIQPQKLEETYDDNDIFNTCINLEKLFNLPLTLKTLDVRNSIKYNVEEIIYEL